MYTVFRKRAGSAVHGGVIAEFFLEAGREIGAAGYEVVFEDDALGKLGEDTVALLADFEFLLRIAQGRDVHDDDVEPRAPVFVAHELRLIEQPQDLLRIGPEDRVLEIGPGPGAITGIIHERGPAEFRLIEKDSYWAAHHAELERPAPAVQVLNADALAFPWESLEGPWKIISNLPYNVGSPLMWDIVSRTPDLTRAVFMVQKEVAERLYAKPGTKDYGALSVWIDQAKPGAAPRG